MTTEEYRQRRSIAKQLTHKMVEGASNIKLRTRFAGQKLGIWQKGAFFFDTEHETDSMMDLMIYEKGPDGKILIENFYDSDVELTDEEEEVLEGMMDQHPSIYEVVSINQETHTLQMADIINTNKEYTLIDLGFSQTAKPGVILFTRLISIGELYMTSGIFFGFHAKFKKNFLILSIYYL